MGANGNAHQPTAETRRLVQSLAGFGVGQVLIAAELGISDATLRKHYPDELATGVEKANALVTEALFKKATAKSGPQSVTAAIFWLKARAGWKDTSVVEHTGKDGGPQEIKVEWV